MTRLANANVAAIKTVSGKPHENAPNVGANAAQRTDIAQALSRFLASTYALYQKSLFYHWNVTGPNFLSLHELFEQHYNDLHEAGDTIAERVRALGHFAPGTMTEFAALSSVEEDKKLPDSSRAMIDNLLRAHEICSSEARRVLELAGESSDEVTVDLMVQRMAFHDKAAWMLRATQ